MLVQGNLGCTTRPRSWRAVVEIKAEPRQRRCAIRCSAEHPAIVVSVDFNLQQLKDREVLFDELIGQARAWACGSAELLLPKNSTADLIARK